MQTSAIQSHNTVILQDEGLRKLKGFVQIPRAVLMHKRISFGAKVAYGVLLGYAWQDDFCFPAQQALADDLACSVRQAQRFLDELRKMQFISWKQQGLNRPNVYFILPMPTETEQGEVLKNKDTTHMSHPDTTHMSGQDTTNMSYKVYSSNNTHKTVNGSEKGRQGKTEEAAFGDMPKQGETKSENPIRKLPLLDQPHEKTHDIAERILERIGDPKSKKFYLLVASRIPEIAIKNNVGEIVADGADDPAKLFTYRMMKWAEEKLAQGGSDEVKNLREGLRDAMQV